MMPTDRSGLETRSLVEGYRRQRGAHIVTELAELVALPNNALHAEELARNAEFLAAQMKQRGITTELIPNAVGRPVVLGELPAADADAPTLLFYGHYDGAPVDPETWHSDPYDPVLRATLPEGKGADWSRTLPLPKAGNVDDDWRLFGRSTADAKAAIISILTAIDVLRDAGLQPTAHLKLLFEGEEEQESPHLAAFFAEHGHRLAADLAIIAEGPVHQSGLPTVDFGVRGMMVLDLEVYGALSDLHSGHYGNWAPNPAFRLARLLSSMKDETGRILVPGFYDEVEPLSPSEERAITEIPGLEAESEDLYAIGEPEGGGQSLQELINLPTLNVRGMASGRVGNAAANVVPSTATASLDIRLVKGMSERLTFEALTRHIRAQGYTLLDRQPSAQELRRHPRIARLTRHAGFPAARTPLDHPLAAAVARAVATATGERTVVQPTEGGSLQLHRFEDLGIPFVGLPTFNFDSHQHADDENLHLRYFFRGIVIFAEVLRLKWQGVKRKEQ